jgi:DNA-binding transcriptional regulator PaaX
MQKAILYALAAVGGLAMAVVAPNALQVFEQFGWIKPRRGSPSRVHRSVERLERNGLVKKDQSGFVVLTRKGERRLAEIERMHYKLPWPEKWDGKWRVVSFDIKEKRKHIRALLRETLSAVGFVHLHHSVWVYPHDCKDFLSLLKADFHIGVEVLYIIAEYIENDGWLRRRFGL